ncbi:MAG TPA: sn-glycerol-3-phosphate ABC transporter ATP-binding protein UgpC [Steroidobacteraceae bacterium]
MAAISIRGMHKNYGDVPVLRGIDLDIQNGEFVALVGPSGCGKSTLLRLIAGLEPMTGGDIRIGERLVNDLAPKDRDIAMVFQSYALYPHMTVRDNLTFSLKLRGVSRERIAAAVRAASAKLELTELLDRKPAALSGGQRQRVAMGRAMVREPQAFLFDEPLSNLDARLREQMRYEIRKLQRELGTTSIYVTHDQIEAMTMADRIVALNDGVVQQVGTPNELYDDPANVFVAGFMGSPAMNFIDGVLQDHPPAPAFAAVMVGDTPLGLVKRPAGMSAGQRVLVGLRPERIALQSAAAGVPAEVDLVEPTGVAMILRLRLAGQPFRLFTTERLDVKIGERVGLRVHAPDLLLFDPGSGLRLR